MCETRNRNKTYQLTVEVFRFQLTLQIEHGLIGLQWEFTWQPHPLPVPSLLLLCKLL